jgi:hypothetical protein
MKYFTLKQANKLVVPRCAGCQSIAGWCDGDITLRRLDSFIYHWNLRHRHKELKGKEKLKVVDGSKFIRLKPPQ